MPLIRRTPEKAPPPGEAGEADLQSASAGVRWAAARAAADRPESVPALAEALRGETDARVREAIFTALARIGSPESIDAVLPFLRSDDASLRTAALDVLRAAPNSLGARIEALLADPDDDVRLLSCELVRAMDPPRAGRLLLSLIDADPAANVCAAAIEVLAEIGDRDALPALARCAARFPNDPFLAFAVKVASDRLNI
ncbi:MAG TPA: HEAT repeat domain-containing protein [Roseiarcus sp.]|jgi:HEAT repeat protein